MGEHTFKDTDSRQEKAAWEDAVNQGFMPRAARSPRLLPDSYKDEQKRVCKKAKPKGSRKQDKRTMYQTPQPPASAEKESDNG